MIRKLNRYQLLILCLLSSINIIFYFMGDWVPDNTFQIQGDTSTVNSFTYYLSSFASYISYYVGPWIIFPFFASAFVYSFLVSKRESEIDIFIPTSLILVFYFLSLLLFPSLVGSGLTFLSYKAFSTYTIFFSTLIFSVVALYLCLQGSFLDTLQALQLASERIGAIIWRSFGRGLNKVRNISFADSGKTKKIQLQQRAIGFIKDGAEKLKEVASKKTNEESPIQENISEEITPIVRENREEVQVSAKTAVDKIDVENFEEPIKHRGSESTEFIDKSVRRPKRAPSFFKSSELVDCINIPNKVINNTGDDSHYFNKIMAAIEDKLNEFKLPAKIINVLKGPVVDTFELELGEGVKLSKVLNLSDDIGLALNGVPIRIVYPLRGKSTIGIEVPRNPREIIYLDDVLKNKAYGNSTLRLPVMMGKDAFGETKVVDLAAMPHMLVAGATGAGKSVFINTMLVSLIIKKSPRELKLVLIDPKQLELALYERLPHLLMPVITEAKMASVAMLWLVQEMDRRYSILKEMAVKNIEGFNKKVKSCDPKMLHRITKFYEDQEDDGYELPYIVCIIDEFADLILTKSGKEIEINVNRLAAKARAAGIHLVVATQRPSTDVITGTIKANFPTRVAFTVTTGIDSRTILEQYGAEKLLKRGDMLFKQGVDLFRLHSAYVEEEEIEGLVDKLAEIPLAFSSNAVNFLENTGEDEDMNGEVKMTFVSGTSDDPVYNEAIEIVMQKGSASASMLQRALRVGYNRAANIIDEMEKNGIVGPAQGSKPRKVIGRSE
jgi:S-DNA-T family DNA segregation ATPase FtsK/SpoIIIE